MANPDEEGGAAPPAPEEPNESPDPSVPSEQHGKEEQKTEDGSTSKDSPADSKPEPAADDAGTKAEDAGTKAEDAEMKEGKKAEKDGEDGIKTTETQEGSGDAGKNDNNNNNDANNNNNNTTNNDTVETASATKDEEYNIANSKGAKILMNRFSSWTQSANENAEKLWKQTPVLEEKAKSLWKQAPNLPVMARFQETLMGGTKGAPGETDEGKEGENQSTVKEGDESESATPVDASPNDGDKPAASQQDSVTKTDSSGASDGNNPAEKGEAGETASPKSEEETVDPRVAMGAAISKASVAASVVAESVATSFRGRYSSKATPTAPPAADQEANTRSAPESQTELILKSRVGKHMQEILDKLEPYEYAMLLGSGMLGVNLKQCYLKNHGAFIDFLVEGGQAELSGIVRTGDLPVRLGDVDLRKLTILDIPGLISKARRPVVLILATGTKVHLERMSFIDIAVAMMHRARKYYNKRGTLSILPSASVTEGEQSSESETTNANNAESSEIKSVSEANIQIDDTIDSFVTPPAPSLELRKEFVDEVPLRCFDKFIISGLSQVIDLDPNFRSAVRNAFLTCSMDARRLPFLARHFSTEDLPEALGENKMAPSAQLMLFLELASFLDLYGVTPAAKLRDTASRIAYKFFLPTSIGQRLQPPLFDFHQIVPDSSLRHLEFVLSGKSQTIPRDVFLDFQRAIVDALTDAPLISFLASSECARMRAYLRNTAPYVNLPLRELFDSLVGEAKATPAKNCFAYMLLFLICQVEKEPAGEHNFVSDTASNRLLGAPNDICCAIFIKRNLIPALEKAKEKVSASKSDEEFDGSVTHDLLSLCERFWDTHILGVPDGRAKSNEIGVAYGDVKKELEVLSEKLKAVDVEKAARNTAELLTKSNLVKYATTLSEELLYNYAANVHNKFREHKFHEWMCNELSKTRAADSQWSNRQELPILPQGCIKRLLRKANLPDGVSSHKPRKLSAIENEVSRNYPNADYAVVFGTTVGTELASQMHRPGIESSDIRRYTCQQVALDRELDFESSSEEEIIPATFESYAVVPKRNHQPFSQFTDATRLSVDGWEVSLVSFSIPSAESSGDPSSGLFGVSLFFQSRKVASKTTPDDVKTVLVKDKKPAPEGNAKEENQSDKNEDGNTFESPIMFKSAEAEGEPGTEETEKVLQMKVSSDLPVLNNKLREPSWVERSHDDEYRDSSKPLSIGLALVSRRNVILAMRESLSKLLADFSRQTGTSSPSGDNTVRCSALVNLLGVFSFKEIESSSLRCILEPYLRAGSAPWIERPIADQENAFQHRALQHFSDCLPPTPMALLFVTALLEQKIVLSSSRRSMLMSATIGLGKLMSPLKWSHLLVPLAPASLAADLIQYPAPFILGICSEEEESRDILGNLPTDVSLVDLDVGRVILAPAFGHDNEMVRRSSDSESTAKALRSQVLFLAQTLGRVFGNSLRPDTWGCDNPIFSTHFVPSDDKQVKEVADTAGGGRGVKALISVANAFVEELLEGVPSCCYWIEEINQGYGTAIEPTVLFDEDRFFEIKNHRAGRVTSSLKEQNLFAASTKTSAGGTTLEKELVLVQNRTNLALTLDDFDLILESFLRCQSISTYLSSRPKTEMVYY